MTVDWSRLGTAGRCEAIRKVWKLDISAKGIADALGVSRNAVIGMYHRYPDSFSQHPLQTVNGGDGHVRDKAARARESYKVGASAKPRPAPLHAPVPALRSNGIAQAAARAPEPEPCNTILEHLRSGLCYWPVNESGPFLFCGNGTEPLKKYCPHHQGRAVSGRMKLGY